MKAPDAIRLLQQHESALRQLGVERLYLFGSTARNEARDDSDIDLFFDHARGQLGLYELMDVKERTRKILGRPTDITTRAGLHPALRGRIEETAIRVF
jgi:predicted nucleotidyltransferase